MAVKVKFFLFIQSLNISHVILKYMGQFNVVNIENHNHIIVNGFKWWNPFTWGKKERLTKDTVRILFIDDLYFPIVDNLQRAGYNVKRKKDAKDVDDSDVKDCHVIFVDYDGVGKNFSEVHQGAALVKEIKNKYGARKFVVLYTDQAFMSTETSMNNLFMAADAHMRKSSSDASDFIAKIDEGLNRIRR